MGFHSMDNAPLSEWMDFTQWRALRCCVYSCYLADMCSPSQTWLEFIFSKWSRKTDFSPNRLRQDRPMGCWDTKDGLWRLGRAWQCVCGCVCVCEVCILWLVGLCTDYRGRVAPLYFTIVPSLLLRATSLCRRATASFSLNRGRKGRKWGWVKVWSLLSGWHRRSGQNPETYTDVFVLNWHHNV